jgi:hypothetical protein
MSWCGVFVFFCCAVPCCVGKIREIKPGFCPKSIPPVPFSGRHGSFGDRILRRAGNAAAALTCKTGKKIKPE